MATTARAIPHSNALQAGAFAVGETSSAVSASVIRRRTVQSSVRPEIIPSCERIAISGCDDFDPPRRRHWYQRLDARRYREHVFVGTEPPQGRLDPDQRATARAYGQGGQKDQPQVDEQ